MLETQYITLVIWRDKTPPAVEPPLLWIEAGVCLDLQGWRWPPFKLTDTITSPLPSFPASEAQRCSSEFIKYLVHPVGVFVHSSATQCDRAWQIQHPACKQGFQNLKPKERRSSQWKRFIYNSKAIPHCLYSKHCSFGRWHDANIEYCQIKQIHPFLSLQK